MLFWVLVVSGTVFFFTKSLKRLFQVTSGLIILETYNSVWDIGVWPVIQHLFGGYGVLGLTIAAVGMNFAVLHWYKKHCKVDWLGITVVNHIVLSAQKMRKSYEKSTGISKKLKAIPFWFMSIAEKLINGKWVPILVLSIFTDGFVATAYYLNWKYGTVQTKLRKGDCIFLCVSTVVGCMVWALFTEVITLPAFKSLLGGMHP